MKADWYRPADGTDVPQKCWNDGHDRTVDHALEQESRYEPVDFIRASRIVVRTGTLLLAAGSGSYRVKIAMGQVGRALAMTEVQALVTVNEITATCHRAEIYRTEIAQTQSIGVNSDRIKRLQNFCAQLEPSAPGVTQQEVTQLLDEIEKELDAIENRGPLWGSVANACFAAVACAAFAFLNNGGPIEMAVVFLGAGLGQLSRRLMLHRGYNQLAVTMFAAAVASIVYLAVAHLLISMGVVVSLQASGYISAVLFLVPGFPLISSALDLSRLDFSAGMSRLFYALMIMTSAALSVWAVSAFLGLDPVPAGKPELSAGLFLVFRLVASALGVWGFALIFNSPMTLALWAALIGMIANVVRLELIDLGVLTQAAAFIAGLIVGVLANLIAPRVKIPRLTLSVPAVVIMVPGAAGYRAIFYLNSGSTLEALAYGVEAVFVVIAIAIGLTIARSLTDRNWVHLGKD